ncbi:hypothetical protein MIMGU_mgv11b021190mg [Erythranthe guttata]|uniref:Uncharacterized protein n=1 Tax=Erythranthe guttata TaxID=4155 RepID=A0A022RVL6_ERYGU|nr:hypothetical protein MIMGU_mgv11b021190mg [Erythranthe guttata]
MAHEVSDVNPTQNRRRRRKEPPQPETAETTPKDSERKQEYLRVGGGEAQAPQFPVRRRKLLSELRRRLPQRRRVRPPLSVRFRSGFYLAATLCT